MKILSRIFLSGAVVATSALAFIAQAQTMSGHDHHAAAPPPSRPRPKERR